MNVFFLNTIEQNSQTDREALRKFANSVCAQVAKAENLDPVRDAKAIQSIAKKKHPELAEAFGA